MRFTGARLRAPDIDAWFDAPNHEIRAMALPWFERMRACGGDVRELMHDGCPTACVEDAAFAYVGAFTAHINIGFFHGAFLSDPLHLLQGSGKRMRHVKIYWGKSVDAAPIGDLISAAYHDIQIRLSKGE